jgi:hypothetical protein
MSGIWMQLQSKGADDFQNGIEAGATFTGKPLTEALADQFNP